MFLTIHNFFEIRAEEEVPLPFLVLLQPLTTWYYIVIRRRAGLAVTDSVSLSNDKVISVRQDIRHGVIVGIMIFKDLRKNVGRHSQSS